MFPDTKAPRQRFFLWLRSRMDELRALKTWRETGVRVLRRLSGRKP